MKRPATHDEFVSEMTAWLNALLAPQGTNVDAQTPLFEGGLINSIRVLEVIAWVERASGAQIPDRQIRMDNFSTIEHIARVFGPGRPDARV